MTTGESVACWGPMWELRLRESGWSGSDPMPSPSSSQAPSIRLLFSSSLDASQPSKLRSVWSLSAAGVGSTPGPMPLSFPDTGTWAGEERKAYGWPVGRVHVFVMVQCHSWALDDGEVACREGGSRSLPSVVASRFLLQYVFDVVPLNESSLVMDPVSQQWGPGGTGESSDKAGQVSVSFPSSGFLVHPVHARKLSKPYTTPPSQPLAEPDGMKDGSRCEEKGLTALDVGE